MIEIVPRDHEQLLGELKQLTASLGLDKWTDIKESNLTPEQHRQILEWRKSVALRDREPELTDDTRKAIENAESFGEIVTAVGDLGAPRRCVRLKADEVFRGEVGGEVELSTGFGGADCGYPFEMGRQYLVFAYHSNGGTISRRVHAPRPRRPPTAAKPSNGFAASNQVRR